MKPPNSYEESANKKMDDDASTWLSISKLIADIKLLADKLTQNYKLSHKEEEYNPGCSFTTHDIYDPRMLRIEYLNICDEIIKFVYSDSNAPQSFDKYTQFTDRLRALVHCLEENMGSLISADSTINRYECCPVLKIEYRNFYQYLSDPSYHRYYTELPEPKGTHDIRKTIPKELFRYLPLHICLVSEPHDSHNIITKMRGLDYTIYFQHKHKPEIISISIDVEEIKDLNVYSHIKTVLPEQALLRFNKKERELLHKAVLQNQAGKSVKAEPRTVSDLNTFMFRILAVPHFLELDKEANSKSDRHYRIHTDYRDHVILKKV